jgi:sugar phosphate isomerase/epimerase
MNRQSTRRTFFGAAAGIAGLAALDVRPAGAVVEEEPGGIKLGVATYSLREFKDRAKVIEMIKALKTPFISIKDVHLSQTISPAEVEGGAKEFTNAGLKIMSGGNITLNETTAEAMRKHFEYAKHAGMRMIVCAPTPGNVKVVESLAKEYDIKCAIHNHGPEDKNFPTPESVLAAVKNLDARMGLCMDVGHTSRAGSDIVKNLADAGPRLLDMHIKDLIDPKGKDSQCPVGDGKLPIVGIFKQLRKMGYKGCVNLEYEIEAKDPMLGMQKSFSYMRGVLAGLAG